MVESGRTLRAVPATPKVVVRLPQQSAYAPFGRPARAGGV